MFISGLNEIDELYPGLLKPGFVIAIAGPYGSGKTLLASTMCYSNAEKGQKCLYVTFYETRDKFYDIMSRLGLRFSDLERKGLFEYVKLPIFRNVDSIVNELSGIIMREKPRIVVIDSINPLIEYIDTAERRAWLHDFLSQVPRLINGVLVVTIERADQLTIDKIGYIADVYIELEYASDRGFISRLLRIRKARGTSLNQIEIPFIIEKDVGIAMIVPETPRTIRVSDKLYRGLIEPFHDYLGYIRAGENILVAYPVDSRMPYWVLLLLQLAMVNNLRSLSVSYNEGPYEQKEAAINLLSEHMGVDKDKASEIIDKYIMFESINPYSLSLTDLVLQEMVMIRRYNPDIVLYHGVEALYPIAINNLANYYQLLANQSLAFKRRGIISIRTMGIISERFYRLMASMADIVIRFTKIRPREQVVLLHVWRKGKEPRRVLVNRQTLMHILSVVSQHMGKAQDQGGGEAT